MKNNLKELRKEKKLSQQEVAKKLNVGQKTYSNYENGITEPNIETLIQMSKLFNITIDNLIKKYLNIDNQNQTPFFQEELIELIKELNQIECAKVEAYIYGLKAGKEEYQQQKLSNQNKGT